MKLTDRSASHSHSENPRATPNSTHEKHVLACPDLKQLSCSLHSGVRWDHHSLVGTYRVFFTRTLTHTHHTHTHTHTNARPRVFNVHSPPPPPPPPRARGRSEVAVTAADFITGLNYIFSSQCRKLKAGEQIPYQ